MQSLGYLKPRVMPFTMRATIGICKPKWKACKREVTCSAQVLEAPSSQKIIYAVAAAPQHDWPWHPECAARVPAILTALEESNLTAKDMPTQLTNLKDFKAATVEDIQAIHSPAYSRGLEQWMIKHEKGHVENETTYFRANTLQDSLRAIGAAMALVDSVVEHSAVRESVTGFGICRPPGHHALPTVMQGFCFLNTVACAARYAQEKHGLKKIMIFDFDVHHGNGTNDIFYDDPDVLFISTHQEGNYPGTGKVKEAGEKDGEGATINLPLPGGSGDSAMMAAFEEIVVPAAHRFAPDVILISAGFDAHWADPLSACNLRSSSYHRLAQGIQKLADNLAGGRCIFLLEGGYNLKALGESVAESFRGILGLPSEDVFDHRTLMEEPKSKVDLVLAEARRIHAL